MEEAVMDPIDLNTQYFINDVINSVDDITDEAFDAFHEEASKMMKTDGSNRADELRQGIDRIHEMVRADMDKQMSLWESFCTRKIFAVPKGGFALAEANEALGESTLGHENAELDVQLAELRSKLSTVGKETGDLKRELRVLERQSILRNQCTEIINEVVELYEKSSDHDMYQEIIKSAGVLRKKMEKAKRQKMEDNERKRIERISKPNIDLYPMSLNNGLSKVELKDLEQFAADLKKI